MRWLLEQKLADAMARPLPWLTRRDIWWPKVPAIHAATPSPCPPC